MNNLYKKYIALFLILTLSLFSLSGCYNIYNIDHLAYVVALGFDVGQNNEIKLSFQLSVPGNSSESGGSSQSDNTIVNSIECSSIDSGINLLNSYLSKEINLSHCKVIVFSEEFAYNGLSKSLYSLINNVQIRPDCSVIISKCNAEYFLSNSEPTLEKLTARYYEVAPTSSDYTGYTEDITLSKFFSDFNSTFSQCHGILGSINTESSQSTDKTQSNSETSLERKPTIENMGLAIFSGDKLVGELSGLDTICHQIIISELDTCNIVIASPFEDGETISLYVRLLNDTKNNVKLTNTGAYITSKVELEARILTMDENSQYLDEYYLKELEKYANSYMQDKIYTYLYKISKEFNSDIDGFGKYAVKNFLTWNDWINYNWLDNFKNSFFEVTVETNIKSGYVLMET